MTASPFVDVHAHVFPAGLANRYEQTGDTRWPWLSASPARPPTPTPEAEPGGTVMVGARAFRHVRAALWDLDARSEELHRAGITHQVVSPMPVLMTYWAPPREAADLSKAVNDGVASCVADAPGLLSGLGTVPLQDTDLAIVELERCMGELGLLGVQIGPRVGDRDLDDPALLPFLARAAELDAVIAVHPLDGGTGVIRREGPPYDFGLGMLTDTAIAATALVFGGVLEQVPQLRVLMAHGCGSFTWAYPRLRFGATLRQPAGLGDRLDELLRQLYVDTLVFDPANLVLLVERFGADRVVVGTDHPFVADQLDPVRCFLADQTEAVVSAITRDNASRLFGLERRTPLAG